MKPFQLTPRSPKCCRTVDQSVGSCLPKRSVIIIKYCTTVTLFCALEKKKPQRRSKGVSARFGVHIALAKIYTIYAQQGRKVTCFFTTIKPVHSATKCTIFLKVQNMTLRPKKIFLEEIWCVHTFALCSNKRKHNNEI